MPIIYLKEFVFDLFFVFLYRYLLPAKDSDAPMFQKIIKFTVRERKEKGLKNNCVCQASNSETP